MHLLQAALPPQYKFPVLVTDYLTLSQLGTIQVHLVQSQLYFILFVPLVQKDNYDLIQLLPLPLPLEGKHFSLLTPTSPYLLINDTLSHYTFVTGCPRIPGNHRTLFMCTFDFLFLSLIHISEPTRPY